MVEPGVKPVVVMAQSKVKGANGGKLYFHEYTHLLSDSVFTFAPSNAAVQSMESHRLWEALLSGSIPVLGSGGQAEKVGTFVPLSDANPIVWVEKWEQLPAVLERLLSMSAAQLDALQARVVGWYACYLRYKLQHMRATMTGEPSALSFADQINVAVPPKCRTLRWDQGLPPS